MVHHARGLPAVKAHALLAGLTFLPYVVHIPYSVNIVLHAALTVYVGSWRSVRDADGGGGPQEQMTNSDAMRFPLVGSCVLFGLFLCFKFLPKELVNLLLAGYITIIGAVVVVGAVLPFVERLFPAKERDRVIRFLTGGHGPHAAASRSLPCQRHARPAAPPVPAPARARHCVTNPGAYNPRPPAIRPGPRIPPPPPPQSPRSRSW
jgi:hypothetical protein